MTADTNITLALLNSIWRAFDETKRSRMHTAELLSELLDMDEGRWREARHGQPITAYYLRDNLGYMLPSNADEIAPRRWRDGSTHQQYGYDILHFKEAFQRYLGKGLPGMSAEKEGRRTARKTTQKHPSHPSHPSRSQKLVSLQILTPSWMRTGRLSWIRHGEGEGADLPARVSQTPIRLRRPARYPARKNTRKMRQLRQMRRTRRMRRMV